MRPDNTITDAEIIDSLTRDGNDRRKAEDQLFNSYSYFVKEGIRKYSLAEEDALDVYSDAVISAIEKIVTGLFEGRSSLKTYLFRIFHNKCVDRIRQLTTNKNKIHRTAALADQLLSNLSDSAKSVVQRMVDRSDFEVLRVRLSERSRASASRVRARVLRSTHPSTRALSVARSSHVVNRRSSGTGGVFGECRPTWDVTTSWPS